jgi:hypothetical protein
VAQYARDAGLSVEDAACMVLLRLLGRRAVAIAQRVLVRRGCSILQAPSSQAAAAGTLPVAHDAALLALAGIQAQLTDDADVASSADAVEAAIAAAAATAPPASSAGQGGMALASATAHQLCQALMENEHLRALMPATAPGASTAARSDARLRHVQQLAAQDVQEWAAWAGDPRCGRAGV